MNKTITQILLALMLSSSCIASTNKIAEPTPSNESTDASIPKNLDECFRELNQLLKKEDINKIRSGTIEPGHLHFGLGMGLRNSWGLWRGSRLAKYFNDMGIHHPDDMSGIILTSYTRHLRGEPLDVAEQVAHYKKYWEDARLQEEKEIELSKTRKLRIENGLMDWVYEDSPVPSVDLPKRVDFKDTWKIIPYREGFVAVFKGYKKSDYSLWHDGIYFINVEDKALHPVRFEDYDLIIDIARCHGTTFWLCLKDKEYYLISDSPDGRDTEKVFLDSKWLRLAVRGRDICLFDDHSFYEKDGSCWRTFYTNKNQTVKWRLFDHDEDKQGETTWSLPRRCDTPIIENQTAYFWSADDGNSRALFRLDLKDAESNFENFQDFFGYDHYGSWMLNVSYVEQKNNGEIWVATGQKNYGSLVIIKEGNYSFPIFAGQTHPQIKFDGGSLRHSKLETEDELMRQIPAKAFAEYEGTLYLVGCNGLYKVINRKVSPVVRFRFPNNITHFDWLQAGYKFRIEPQRLAVFNTDNFLIGDAHSGLYLLSRAGDQFDLEVLHTNIGDSVIF